MLPFLVRIFGTMIAHMRAQTTHIRPLQTWYKCVRFDVALVYYEPWEELGDNFEAATISIFVLYQVSEPMPAVAGQKISLFASISR